MLIIATIRSQMSETSILVEPQDTRSQVAELLYSRIGGSIAEWIVVSLDLPVCLLGYAGENIHDFFNLVDINNKWGSRPEALVAALGAVGGGFSLAAFERAWQRCCGRYASAAAWARDDWTKRHDDPRMALAAACIAWDEFAQHLEENGEIIVAQLPGDRGVYVFDLTSEQG